MKAHVIHRACHLVNAKNIARMRNRISLCSYKTLQRERRIAISHRGYGH